MPSFHEVFNNSATPASAHICAGHVKGHKDYTTGKSWFTDTAGAALDIEGALQLLAKAKQQAFNLAQLPGKRDESKKIEGVASTLVRLDADAGKLGLAVTWGAQTGQTPGGARVYACTWVCMFLTSTPKSGGRYAWVTAFPADDFYVNRHLYGS